MVSSRAPLVKVTLQSACATAPISAMKLGNTTSSIDTTSTDVFEISIVKLELMPWKMPYRVTAVFVGELLTTSSVLSAILTANVLLVVKVAISDTFLISKPSERTRRASIVPCSYTPL